MARELSARGMASLFVCGGTMAALVSGCVLDPKAGYRPARFHVGPNTRTLSVPDAANAPPATTTGAARTTSTSPEDDTQRLGATSVSMQFTMETFHGFYSGVEAETGRLDLPGTTNFAAAYGVVGLQQSVPLGALGAELAAGWQGVRYWSGEEDHDSWVAEPRLRAQLWLAEQWTLGATVGARMSRDGRDDWMAGAYLGVHSHRF
jgi:hypothetical protein